LKLEGTDLTISMFVNLKVRDFECSRLFRQIVTRPRG